MFYLAQFRLCGPQDIKHEKKRCPLAPVAITTLVILTRPCVIALVFLVLGRRWVVVSKCQIKLTAVVALEKRI